MVSALNRATMSATPITKQKEDGIPTCSECAPYRRALFGTCGYVPVACVQDAYSNLHKNKFFELKFVLERRMRNPSILQSAISNLQSTTIPHPKQMSAARQSRLLSFALPPSHFANGRYPALPPQTCIQRGCPLGFEHWPVRY